MDSSRDRSVREFMLAVVIIFVIAAGIAIGLSYYFGG
jgi:hypothetical protein